MKRRITVEQLQELIPEQKQKLREWWKTEVGDKYYQNKIGTLTSSIGIDDAASMLSMKFKRDKLPLLSIGQMIELLESKDQCLNITKRTDLNGWGYEIQLRQLKYCKFNTVELCDALWHAVKQVI